jgi:hypothetical protein
MLKLVTFPSGAMNGQMHGRPGWQTHLDVSSITAGAGPAAEAAPTIGQRNDATGVVAKISRRAATRYLRYDRYKCPSRAYNRISTPSKWIRTLSESRVNPGVRACGLRGKWRQANPPYTVGACLSQDHKISPPSVRAEFATEARERGDVGASLSVRRCLSSGCG